MARSVYDDLCRPYRATELFGDVPLGLRSALHPMLSHEGLSAQNLRHDSAQRDEFHLLAEHPYATNCRSTNGRIPPCW